MKGLAIVIVGYQGAGKSLLAKSLIKGVHPTRLAILDINREYVEQHPDSVVAVTEGPEKGEPDFDRYIEMMIKEKGKIFVTEDATVIFSHRGYDPNLVRAIIKKRHSGNVYIFLFHSLRVVPRDVFEYSDELWLLKTADTDDSISGKYKGTGVQELLDEVRQLPEFEYSRKQKLPVRDEHYKVLFIKKAKVDKTVSKTPSQE